MIGGPIMKQSVIETLNNDLKVGVGLRHQHYEDVLRPQINDANKVDFVEVHAENFYAEGGPALSILQQASKLYEVSIHATSLGLGSHSRIPMSAITSLKKLVDTINPILVSDHACFTWAKVNSIQVHSGDLLPILFNQKTLNRFIENVDQVQQILGRQLVIENLSSYVQLKGHQMQEFEFLQKVCQRTGCGLLVDINNLFVNQVNFADLARRDESCAKSSVANVLDGISAEFVKEIHLAGYSKALPGEMVIDDHSRAVSVDAWQVYQYAIQHFGNIPTTIEWDNQLPSWNRLTAEALTARAIASDLNWEAA